MMIISITDVLKLLQYQRLSYGAYLYITSIDIKAIQYNDSNTKNAAEFAG